jgi:hypothetical protein
LTYATRNTNATSNPASVYVWKNRLIIPTLCPLPTPHTTRDRDGGGCEMSFLGQPDSRQKTPLAGCLDYRRSCSPLYLELNPTMTSGVQSFSFSKNGSLERGSFAKVPGRRPLHHLFFSRFFWVTRTNRRFDLNASTKAFNQGKVKLQ